MPLDVLFIGPSDLSLSHGYPPPSPEPHPEVEKVIQRIVKAAHGAGKKVAMYCPSGAIAKKRTAMGFDAVSVQNDSTYLGMLTLRARANPRSFSHRHYCQFGEGVQRCD